MANIKEIIKTFYENQKEGNSLFVKSLASDERIVTICGVSWVALLIVMCAFKGIFLGFIFTVLLSATVSILAYNIYDIWEKNK